MQIQNNLIMKNKIFKLFQIVLHYCLILLGFIMFSWFIWNRFIRERAIRNVPETLTELSFWVLLYICIVYFYIIKNLLFPKENSII
jgi:DMSO/TMAO reductase YedYZ heme-binding membrane subunit